MQTTKINPIWTLLLWAGSRLRVILGGSAIALSMFWAWYRSLMSNNHQIPDFFKKLGI